MSSVLSSPTLSVPTVTIETSPSAAELKVRVGRARSSSLVKVETVGEDSQEEGLDQSMYGNVNAEWVNRKGTFIGILSNNSPNSRVDCHGYHRCLAHTSSPYYRRKSSCRHHPWNDARTELDAGQPVLPRSTFHTRQDCHVSTQSVASSSPT